VQLSFFKTEVRNNSQAPDTLDVFHSPRATACYITLTKLFLSYKSYLHVKPLLCSDSGKQKCCTRESSFLMYRHEEL